MPCPFFEPLHPAAHPRDPAARLPLVEEYDGTCHASNEAFPCPADRRFSQCNHGYSRGVCSFFPPRESRSCMRFSVVALNPAEITLLCVEERDYAPLGWRSYIFLRGAETIEPDPGDVCIRAQMVAFCRSYLRRALRK